MLEQLIYKWQHSRALIADCLSDNYARLLASGRSVTRSEIERDVKRMLGKFPAMGWDQIGRHPC